mmetsp:Transcript_41004/g.92296  ORF Transcript_41004/g.92296 Transcript_41004/m.92296 type:complete len:223 (+) Transcript_41004:224-892(+)|eukprot:CAMPEP_0172639738 /NCGR_PEP_ID=MMETSP1068-20121228/219674_1 /TAXON_ID=35684 /ORGANISM="Pseudopedinella elastica, Strain CCMP716" /LENGTH=222 /DNA_ID=CAMNT_0013452953 /DNA_START=175 /DNA_END=843 /DNA_ORIENTATION=-
MTRRLHLVRSVLLVATILSSILLARLPPVQRAGMRFFRDLGRIKARRRLYTGSHNSMVIYSEVLLGREPSLLADTVPFVENGVVVDTEELKEADGSETRPIWLSVKGRVYDVSLGSSFYGPDAHYHGFAGRDATRAFCTGCLEPDCLIASTEGLTNSQLREADRWLEYYEHHDKYKYVGRLVNVSGNIDAMVEMALEAESAGDYIPPQLPTGSDIEFTSDGT